MKTHPRIELGLVKKEDTLLGSCLANFWSPTGGIPSAHELITVRQRLDFSRKGQNATERVPFYMEVVLREWCSYLR